MSDYRWLTELSTIFLERDYLVEGQSVDERVDVICNTAERFLNKPGFAAAFKENLKKGWYSLSTPIWTNFGTDRGLPISCFGSYIEDSMDSIAYTWAEVCMMTKHGGGTSAYFGDLRQRGAKIRKNGESSGSVHFMQAFDNLINVVSQGKTRRGNFAAYLRIDHPDILEFLHIRSDGFPIQDLSYGVCVPDYWMEEMIGDGTPTGGDYQKRVVWAKVLEARANLGFPYIVFIDTVNRNTVDCYKANDLKILHSNLCVTGDQFVVTSTGIRKVIDLYDTQEQLTLFDGEKPVSASPMKLIEKAATIYEIETEAGRTHKVTGYHKVKTDIGMVRADSLHPGDKICVQRQKGLFGNKHNPEKAFLLSLYQGDGTQTDETIFIDLWEPDFDLIPEVEESLHRIYQQQGWLQYEVVVPGRGLHQRFTQLPTFSDQKASENGVKKVRIQSSKFKAHGFEKGSIPPWIWEGDEITQWQYVRGLLYTDGSVTLGSSSENPIQISFTSTNLNWLREIQILMSNLGLRPSIHPLNEGGNRSLPNGQGGRRDYICKPTYRLIISNKPDAISIEEATKFLSRKGVVVEDRLYRDNTKKYDVVKEVRLVGNEDVYCTTVDSDEHVWVCNGFITSNCSEIMLPNSHDEAFVCDLASMNLLHYEEWKNTNAVELMAYLLDAVMTEFILKARQIRFLERTVKFAERHRALGIGQLGWHSYLQSKMIPFESMEAKLKNVEIAKNIKEAAYAASAKMAKEYGEPDACKGFGRRNTTLIAIAPTKSSAFILGQVSEGIEPHRTNYYIKDLQKGKFTIKNSHLEQLLREKDMDTDEVWNGILKRGGSVQHLVTLSQHEKNVFKTFAEISPKEVVIQAAQRQKYIDQSQSLNLMIHPSIPIKDVNALMIEGWRMGIKSFYYQISVNAAQQFSRNILSCASCES